MKQKSIWNQATQEGCFFLILGGALLWHGLDSHHKGFNQDWSQSPYLFPVLVAVIMGILAVGLLVEGVNTAKRSAARKSAIRPDEGTDGAKNIRPDEAKYVRQVLVVVAMALLYYLALAVLKIPYITFGILAYSLTISNFEIVTVVFLLAMMLYMGVRRIPVLVLVPLGTSLFLSVTFRAMLHVLLP